MELEIIPIKLAEDLFNEYHNELIKLQSANYCFVSNLDLIPKLLVLDMPIDNKRLAIKNILSFLTYIDNEIKMKDVTVIPISSDILISFFGRDTYKEYMLLLKTLEVISDVPYVDGTFYTKGKLHKQYRVHNSYLNNKDLCIVMLENDRAKSVFTCTEKIDKRFIKTIKELDINMKDAIIAEINHCKEEGLTSNNLRIRLSRLFYTRMKRFIKKGSNVDRIYHSFSNVSKVSRKHLTIKMYNIDIRNSQPLILVSYLKKNKQKFDTNYQLDCETGNFYNKFITTELDKDDVKKSLYKNIFFGFNKQSLINKKFKQLYPLTWSSLEIIHKSDISLAQRLQNLESQLFNNLIPNKSKHYFTLFDAIYFDNINDIVMLNNIITNFFRELEIKVTTEIEY